MQIRNIALTSLIILSGFSAFSQQTGTDTIASTNLDEVVVTGQIEPQSVKKSVFNVRVISRADIQRQAANNLADVLNQYLNIMIQPNSGAGRSTVSMFGLDSNYLKILVDNIPLVSDTGLGNNIDVTQINLDDVERIEIIEGAMGVTHGANAVSGIINIITRKNTTHKWEINTTLQEESIGDEYAPAKDKGRHIQSIRVAHNISENWFVAIGANRNDFTGFKDNRGGRDFTDFPADINLQRGYSWLPKEQLFTNALLRYQKGNTRLFYKFEYFNEDIDSYDPSINSELVGNEILLWSPDRQYNTQKIYNHLNAVGKLFNKLDYNVSGSYQKQQRNVDIFKYYIQTGQKQTLRDEKYQETEVLYSTGTLSNFFKNETADLQIGYEAVNTNGYSSSLSGNFNNDDQQGHDLKKRLENYDVFAASEIKVTNRFSVRPGFRYSFQSRFDDQWAASMGLRQLYDNGFESRASYGRSYRTPTYDELYTYMVDANHNLQGNPDLIPETGNSYEVNFKKVTVFDTDFSLTNSLSASYLDVNDRIEQVVVAVVPSLQYKYINIDKYKMWNFTTTHSVRYKNLEAKAGAVLMGISRKVDSGLSVSDDTFLYTYQLNANVAYTVPKWNTVFSAFYKLNGKQQQFVSNGSFTNEQFELQQIESFGLLDASVKKSFFGNRLDATIGARNLLNVVNVRSNIASGGSVHTAGSTDFLLGYGRSYFAKLTYNLNF
jgi:outer membrane receptor for ferrienterochelin and colicins